MIAQRWFGGLPWFPASGIVATPAGAWVSITEGLGGNAFPSHQLGRARGGCCPSERLRLSRVETLRGPLDEADVEAERLDPPCESLRLDGWIVTTEEVIDTGVVVEGTRAE